MSKLPAHIRKNDRIVFLGDSITEQQLYTNYVETYLSLRYPELNLSFFNAGWGGDTAPGGLKRLMRDVLSLKPTLVTIFFGMNDGGYVTSTPAIRENFAEGIRGLTSELKKAGVRVILLTPGAVDDRINPLLAKCEYNRRGLRLLANEVLAIAKSRRLPTYDIHALMTEVDKKAKRAVENFTMIPDAVHPDPAGHLVIAYGFLKALGVPSMQQVVTLDLNSGNATAPEGIAARFFIDETGAVINLELTLDRLPFFVEPAARKVLPFLPFQEEFNTLVLSIKGAGSKRFIMKADMSRSKPLSGKVLEKGINFFNHFHQLPMLESANALRFTNEKSQIFFKLWRSLSLNNVNGTEYHPEAHRLGAVNVKEIEAFRNNYIKRANHTIRASLFTTTMRGEQVGNGDCIATWNMTGPFSRPFTKDHLGGEKAFSTVVPATAKNWTPQELQIEDFANGLGLIFGQRENCVAYGYTVINSTIAQKCELLLGSDDGYAVWLNGELIGNGIEVMRACEVDQNRFGVTLKAGKNMLLVKISQVGGNWGFCVRFTGLTQPVSATRE